MQIKKVLYIEPGVDEKASSRMLEKSTEAMANPVAFTVVSNAFIGLECTEHTCYDAIIVKSDLPDLQATDMLRILTNVGATTPMILLVDRNIDVGSRLRNENMYRQFFAVLHKPFSTAELCGKIQSAIDNDTTLDTQLSAGGTIHRELTRQNSNGYRNQQAQPPQQQFHTLSSLGAGELVDEELLMTFDTQASFEGGTGAGQGMLFAPGGSSREEKSPHSGSHSGNSTDSVEHAVPHRSGGRGGRGGGRQGRGGRRVKPTNTSPTGQDMSNSDEDEGDQRHGSYFGEFSSSARKSTKQQQVPAWAALPTETPRDAPELLAFLDTYAASIHKNESYQRMAEYVVTTEGAPGFGGRLPEGLGGGDSSRGRRHAQSSAVSSLLRQSVLPQETRGGDQLLQMHVFHQQGEEGDGEGRHGRSGSYSQSDISRLMSSPNVFKNDLLSGAAGPTYLCGGDDDLLSSGASSVGVSSTMNTYTHSQLDFTLTVDEVAVTGGGGAPSSGEKSPRKRSMG